MPRTVTKYLISDEMRPKKAVLDPGISAQMRLSPSQGVKRTLVLVVLLIEVPPLPIKKALSALHSVMVGKCLNCLRHKPVAGTWSWQRPALVREARDEWDLVPLTVTWHRE